MAAGDTAVRRWHLGLPETFAPDDGVIGYSHDELTSAAPHVAEVRGLHDVLADPKPPRASEVEVHLPSYRPRTLVPVLAWLAARMADPGGEVRWPLGKRQGPDSVLRLLEAGGWKLEKQKAGKQLVVLRGTAPEADGVPEPPEPAGFEAQLGAREVTLRADYGVFSPRQVDDGTLALLDVALRQQPVDVVADIGIGYAPLAIGLVLNGVAAAAVGTDVDCLAIWLARGNAAALDVPLTLTCDPDPLSVPMTPLTVCNVPTHIQAPGSARLMAGLVARAQHGKLLAVVHESLQERYARYFTSAQIPLTHHRGEHHVILETVN
ncbi:class I SAM-dependent methyltransferase [Flindersiella endophytica]